MGNHARTLHKWFEFDWFLGLDDLALYMFWVRGHSHGFTMTGYSDAFDGWGTMLRHCTNGLNLILVPWFRRPGPSKFFGKGYLTGIHKNVVMDVLMVLLGGDPCLDTVRMAGLNMIGFLVYKTWLFICVLGSQKFAMTQ